MKKGMKSESYIISLDSSKLDSPRRSIVQSTFKKSIDRFLSIKFHTAVCQIKM